MGAGKGAGLARRTSKWNLECAGPGGDSRSGASVWRWGSGCLGITSQWGFSGNTWIPDVRRWTCLPGTFLCNPPPRRGSRVLILKSKLQMMGLCKMMGLGYNDNLPNASRALRVSRGNASVRLTVRCLYEPAVQATLQRAHAAGAWGKTRGSRERLPHQTR